MSRQHHWKLSLIATAVSVVVTALVLVFSYPHAVQWFNALKVRDKSAMYYGEAPVLPVTGADSDALGFPWWAVAVIVSVVVTTILMWDAVQQNLLLRSSRALAKKYGKRARAYGAKAENSRRDGDHSRSRQEEAASRRFARAAIALQSTSRGLERLSGVELDTDSEAFVSAEMTEDELGLSILPPVPENPDSFLNMPPRIDSLGNYLTMPPRIPLPTVVMPDDDSNEDAQEKD